MTKSSALPADFDPQKYPPRKRTAGKKASELHEGVNILAQHDLGQVELFEIAQTRDAVMRCWHCYRQPDGSFDCFMIDCPPIVLPPDGGTS